MLEIGTFTGYSALCMAEALPENGRLITCEIKPKHAEIAQSFFDRSPHGRKIKIHLVRRSKRSPVFPRAAKFDFVFLDADKENYVNYYEAVLPRLRSGGLIVADNVLWSGRVLAPKKKTDRAVVRFQQTRLPRPACRVRDAAGTRRGEPGQKTLTINSTQTSQKERPRYRGLCISFTNDTFRYRCSVYFINRALSPAIAAPS